MLKKYKVINSTNEVYQNIEMPFDFSDKNIGDTVNIFNEDFTITQTGLIYQCVAEKAVMTLQEVEEKNLEEEE